MTISMKRKLLSLVLVVLLAAGFYGTTHQGEFYVSARSVLEKEYTDFSEPVYIGNGITWKGFWNPTILDVEVMGDDNYFRGQEELPFEIFMEEAGHVGVVAEKDLDASFQMASLGSFPIRDQNMNIVFRIDREEDQIYLDHLRSIRISYSILGMTRSRIINLKDEV